MSRPKSTAKCRCGKRMYALGMCDTHYRQIRYQRKFGGRPYEPLKHVLGAEHIQRSIAIGLSAPFPDLPNTGVNEMRRMLEDEYRKRHETDEH